MVYVVSIIALAWLILLAVCEIRKVKVPGLYGTAIPLVVAMIFCATTGRGYLAGRVIHSAVGSIGTPAPAASRAGSPGVGRRHRSHRDASLSVGSGHPIGNCGHRHFLDRLGTEVFTGSGSDYADHLRANLARDGVPIGLLNCGLGLVAGDSD